MTNSQKLSGRIRKVGGLVLEIGLVGVLFGARTVASIAEAALDRKHKSSHEASAPVYPTAAPAQSAPVAEPVVSEPENTPVPADADVSVADSSEPTEAVSTESAAESPLPTASEVLETKSEEAAAPATSEAAPTPASKPRKSRARSQSGLPVDAPVEDAEYTPLPRVETPKPAKKPKAEKPLAAEKPKAAPRKRTPKAKPEAPVTTSTKS